MRFTPAQEAAIRADNRELLVSAAAGSGKTAVLVERIVRLVVERGVSIDRMLIVTFTRAAAGEMRERLETRLNEAAADHPRLARQADLVSMAQISTIHSYCQQVVRQNFQRCGVDPQFMLADERTRAAYWQDAMEETLDWLYEAAHGDERLAALTGKFGEREIALMLETLYRFLMSRPDPMAWLKESAEKTWSLESMDGEPLAQAFCREAALILDGMDALWREADAMRADEAFPPPYLNTLQSDRAALDGLRAGCEQGMRALCGALAGLKFATLGRFKPATGDEERLAGAFKDLRSRIKDMADDLKKLLPADFEQGVADMQAMEGATRGLATAVRHLHEGFQARKLSEACIDFGDLEHMTLAVLRDPDMRDQQAQRFDAVFVDEYQDVSALQEAILNALKRGAGQSYFYVGDVKQSIYRFRLAEPGLFLRKFERFSSRADAPFRRVVLNLNFRSRAAVLDAVNRVFSHVMDRRVTEIDYDADARLYPGIPSQGDPATELHVLNAQGRRPQDMVLAEAELIARDILATVGEPVPDAQGQPGAPLHYRDIAILLPVGKNVADKVELVLGRMGIPVYCEGGGDPMASDEVDQVIQHLTLLDNLANDVALLSELRCPLFEMTERELADIRLLRPQREASFLSALQTAAHEAREPLAARCRAVLEALEAERFYARSMPLAEYLWSFLKRSGLYAHYGAQPGGKLRQANLRMLCHRADDYERSHTDGLHGFVEAVRADGGGGSEQSPAVMNPWEDVVRIMTIHKSKGLEFPTVYVMGLGGPLLRRAQTRALSLHGEIGFGLGYVNEKARTRRTTLLQGAVALRERSAERAERARVLYVAMTRPKVRLVLVGSLKNPDPASAGRSGGVYGVREARSMLDWLLQSAQPGDGVTVEQGGQVSTVDMRETGVQSEFPTQSTGFPQKSAPWRIVFHMEPVITRHFIRQGAPLPFPLPEVTEERPAAPIPAPQAAGMDWPAAAAPQERARSAVLPLKLGVTALCRALDGAQTLEEAAEEEEEQLKRLPYDGPRPRLLSSLPAMPAFLEPPEEEAGLLRGVQTHRLLGLMDLAGARAAGGDERAIFYHIKEELSRLVEKRVMTPAEAALANAGMAARFLAGPVGQRMLAASTVRREWSFNLRISEPFPTLLQGVIDLCFLEDGAWVLVDFKTDRVSSGEELWRRYGRQIALYRRALLEGTPWPVREWTLYSLRLGKAFAKYDEETLKYDKNISISREQKA